MNRLTDDEVCREIAEMAKNGLISFGFAASQIEYTGSMITSMQIDSISLEKGEQNDKPGL